MSRPRRAPSAKAEAGARAVLVALFLLVIVGPLWVILGLLVWAASPAAGIAWFIVAGSAITYAAVHAARKRR